MDSSADITSAVDSLRGQEVERMTSSSHALTGQSKTLVVEMGGRWLSSWGGVVILGGRAGRFCFATTLEVPGLILMLEMMRNNVNNHPVIILVHREIGVKQASDY